MALGFSVFFGFWQVMGENNCQNLISLYTSAKCDFLINPVGPIGDLEASLSKYDVFGGHDTHGRKVPTREHARIRNIETGTAHMIRDTLKCRKIPSLRTLNFCSLSFPTPQKT